MSDTSQKSDLVAVAVEYFRRSDAGRADIVDLFTDDVQIYFPKFGVGQGKAAYFDLAKGLLSVLASLAHDIDDFRCVASGNTVVVEGTTYGAAKDGAQWAGGKTSGGRFCSVFEFRDGLISRMHIYLDPDYLGANTAGFLWSDDKSRRW